MHVSRIRRAVRIRPTPGTRPAETIRRAALAVVLLAAATSAFADVVHDWNAIMVTRVAGQNPFAQARTAAMVQLAVFEAVNAIHGEYKPYKFRMEAPAGASAEAAAVAAAHGVLRAFFPEAAASLDAARAASLAALGDGQATLDGVAVGEAAAAAMVADRANDGSETPAFHVPASQEAGEWQATASCPPAGGVLRHWGSVVPFGIPAVERFRSAPPPPLSSGKYARDYNEVFRLGRAGSAERPPDRADVARYYNLVLAVATWNPAVRQVSAAAGLSLAENARLFALLNMAMSDALVAVMDTKYHHRFWRPETAIRAGDLDGNERTAGDATFTPFIPAPCFPSYGSAHAAAAHAALRVARHLLGPEFAPITLSSSLVPGVTLTYTTFQAIADDIDDARVYGGIHFRFDQEAGALQGKRIGDWIVSHHLKPR